MRLLLKLISGEEIKQTVDSTVCVIGRSSKSDVVVPHEGMSRQHCQLEFVNGEFFITDLGSTNGVMLDGERIEPHKKIKYQTFIALSFGPVVSCQILPDENTQTTMLPPPLVSKTSNSGQSSITKTKAMKDSTKPGIDQKSTVKPPPESKSWIIKVALIALLAGGAFWYFVNQDSLTNNEVQTEPGEGVE